MGPPMSYLAFEDKSMDTVSEALEIAEDKTGNYYRFSIGQWKRHKYDVKTLMSLADDEITSYAFALLNKYSRVIEGDESRTKRQDFYFICLQDHRILSALRRDKELTLIPLLVYIFTHELVHIVRFCNFFQRFEVSGRDREKEEKLVHATTYDILKTSSLPKMDYILESYKWHRFHNLFPIGSFYEVS
jgi:hypothetical protein